LRRISSRSNWSVAAALADATSGLDLTEDFALGAQQHDAPYPYQATSTGLWN
jgi:hypothetical protein